MRHYLIVCLTLLCFGCTTQAIHRQAADASFNENYAEAGVLWLSLAEKGDARAQFSLGELYHEGLGIEADIDRAIHWYTRAAEQGHVDAQNNLGIIYADGDEVSPDYRTAIKWYTLAAEQGDPGAQFNLGAIYLEEQAVQDPMRAYMWWGISAYLGNDLAGSQLEYAAESLSEAQVAEARRLARRCVKQKFRDCWSGRSI